MCAQINSRAQPPHIVVGTRAACRLVATRRECQSRALHRYPYPPHRQIDHAEQADRPVSFSTRSENTGANRMAVADAATSFILVSFTPHSPAKAAWPAVTSANSRPRACAPIVLSCAQRPRARDRRPATGDLGQAPRHDGCASQCRATDRGTAAVPWVRRQATLNADQGMADRRCAQVTAPARSGPNESRACVA